MAEPNSKPEDGLDKVIVAVSTGSIIESSVTMKLTEPLLEPAGMVMVLLDKL